MKELSVTEMGLIAMLISVAIIGVSVLCVWAWESFWDWYDDRMQNSKRIRNAKIDASYTTGQFSVPYNQRDFK
jgi:Flp pilus assembly pilin Flp